VEWICWQGASLASLRSVVSVISCSKEADPLVLAAGGPSWPKRTKTVLYTLFARRKIAQHEPDAKAILPEPRGVKQATSCYLVKTMRFASVRKLGLALPDVELGTMYGAPALKVRGHMFACIASHKSAEPNTLVALVGFDKRAALIAADPETYYLKDHYLNHPSVLVRLSRIRPEALRDVLLKAWRFTESRHELPARRRPQNAGKRKRTVRHCK
jgi:hypothetical protein